MKRLLILSMLLTFMLAMYTFAFADTVQVGTGTATSSYLPIYGLYGYNYTQQIYTQAQINTAGPITKIRFYYVSGTITNSKDWVIYMGHTTKTTFSTTTDWEPLANLTQVFAGDVTSLVPLANNWMEITLTTPFSYDNVNNLIVAVDENTSGYASMSWGGFTSGTNTGIYYYSDTVNPDPAAPPTASSRTATIDRIQFMFPNSAAPLAPVLASPLNGGYALIGDKLYWGSAATGSDATSYDVYFGTSATPPLVSDNQTGANYTPTLAPGTTYYWNVVSNNEIGSSPASATWSFKTPTATQLVESFEPTTFPPAGWANGTTGTWSRSTSYAKHGTASAYKYGSTTTAYVLSTPRLTITPTSTLDIWTLASSATGTLQVVYSPDRVTWTALGTPIAHAATYAWYNTVADLSSLAGNNYYLGIQTGLQSASFYVDLAISAEITPEAPGVPVLTAPADLAINVTEYPSFTWTAPVTGGVPTGYNIYLDTVAGTTLYASNVTSPYTPATALDYNTTYYWTVEAYNGAGTGPMATVRSFTTRANPTVSTFPWEVNFGTLSADWPVLNWSQLTGLYGTTPITGTGWYQDDFANVSTPLNKAAKINIWSTSTKGWLVTPPIAIPASGYELKFDIALTDYAATVPPTAGEQADDKFIVLIDDNPNMSSPTILREWNNTGSSYVFDTISNTGENHIIDLDAYAGTVYFAFYGESTVAGGDNDFFVDNVIVRESPAAPIFTYAPNAINFGMVMNGVLTGPQNVTITNTGGGILNVTAGDISITGANAAQFSFATTNLPAALAGGQSVVIPVSVTGTTEGPISATLTIVNNAVNYDVALAANVLPAGIVVIGDGTANNNLPINPFYGYTYSQSIFLQSELNVADQRIEKIWYNWNGLAEAVDSNNWTIYMGHTAATEFASTTDWVPLANLTQVFSGTVALPATAGWIEIVLTAPFVYNNTDNLVIAVDENAPSYDGSSEFFYSTAAATNRSLRYYSDSTNPDPAAPVAGTLVLAYPNVMLQLGDIPAGAPGLPTLTYPANAALGLPIDGFDLTWSANPDGGVPTLYAVFMSTDEATIYDDVYFETTSTSLNPVTEGLVTFDYLDRWYWTVQAINAAGDDVVEPPYWFEIEDAPSVITTFPWNENFDAATTPPVDWTVADVDGAGTNWVSSPTYSHSAANSFKHGYSTATPEPGQDGWLITPGVEVPTGNYKLSWWNYNVYPTYMVYNGVKVNTTNDPNQLGWTEIWSQTNPTTDWSQVVLDISAYAGQTVYFAFNYQGYDGDDWYVDDVSVFELTVDTFGPVITHLPVINTPREDLAQLVVADIRDDATWNNPVGGANLYYSIDGGTTYSVALNMIAANDTTYYAYIPAQPLATTVTYYLEAWDSLNNMATSDEFSYSVNDPTWIWYDLGGTTYLGYTTTDFGPTVMFENPFYGTENAMQLLATDGSSYYGNAANLQIWTYDGVNDLVPYFATPIPVTFGVQTYETFDLSTYNVQITAPYFFVSYLDVPMGNYILFDSTYDYGTTYVFQGTTLYTMSNSGSWAIGANVTTGVMAGLEAPVVTVALVAGVPTLSWEAVAGAAAYNVYGASDPYAADPWTLLGSTTAISYAYTGTAAMEFFKVTSSDAAPARNANQLTTERMTLRGNRAVRLNNAPKGFTLPQRVN